MLVITRTKGTQIRIDQDIVITVLETGPTKCRLGIEAPRDVLVCRDNAKDKEDHREEA